MSYLFSDSADVHAAAAFGQEASNAMLPRPSNWMRDRHRQMLPQQAARRAALLSRRAQRRGLLPGMSGLGADPSDPHALYAKYAEKASRYMGRISLVRSTNAQRDLQKAFSPIVAERGRIAPAFAPGATPGSRDIDRLNSWVKAVNGFSRALVAAEKQYGTGSLPVPASVSTTEKTETTEGEGIFGLPTPVAIGIAALTLFMIAR